MDSRDQSARGSAHHGVSRPAATRRALLRGVVAASAATVGVSANHAPVADAAEATAGTADTTPAALAGDDATTREVFDRLDRTFNDGDGWKYETNDKDSSGRSGKLAWGEAYVLSAYELMYRTYRDTYYLDKLVDHADHVLANRDSARGVTDFAGHSQPAWRADHHYTIGTVALPDHDGRPAIQVRTALAYADEAVAIVSTGTRAGTFRLDVRHDFYGRTTTYDNLVLDPDSPDYAVERVRTGFRTEGPDRTLVTVKELRDHPTATQSPRPGTHRLHSPPYIFEVHTGQIVQPMVAFARIVSSEPELHSNPRYRDRAEVYLDAAEQAVAVHDPEWRENEHGEGYYVSLPNAPVWWAGMDNPINHFLALGRAVIQLAAATGDPRYADRAEKMGRTLRNDLRLDANGGYVWPYWWSKGAAYNGWDIDNPRSQYRPWYPANTVAEDTSHAQIDVNYALEMFRDLPALHGSGKPVFSGADMRRLARTFTHNVATTFDGAPTVHRYVDGTGPTGLQAYERQAGAWADLTPWDEAILEHLRRVFSHQNFSTGASMLYCVARLNHAARK